MGFDDIPEDKEQAEACSCGGNITQSEHGVWYCDSCAWNSDMPTAIQGITEDDVNDAHGV